MRYKILTITNETTYMRLAKNEDECLEFVLYAIQSPITATTISINPIAHDENNIMLDRLWER